jgi:hypothetical protein
MNQSEIFDQQLDNPTPISDWSDELKAIFYLKKGELDKAHQLVQDRHTKEAYQLHGMVHQLEGDNWNANYWYDRAGVEKPNKIDAAIDQLLNNLIDN